MRSLGTIYRASGLPSGYLPSTYLVPTGRYLDTSGWVANLEALPDHVVEWKSRSDVVRLNIR